MNLPLVPSLKGPYMFCNRSRGWPKPKRSAGWVPVAQEAPSQSLHFRKYHRFGRGFLFASLTHPALRLGWATL